MQKYLQGFYKWKWILLTTNCNHYIRKEQKVKANFKLAKTNKTHLKCNLKKPDITLVQIILLFEN